MINSDTSSLRENFPGDSNFPDESPHKRRESSLPPESPMSPYVFTAVASPINRAFQKINADDETIPDEIGPVGADEYVVPTRALPVERIAIRKLLKKIVNVVASGGRHSIACRLDSAMTLSYWKQFRMALPLILLWATRLLILGFYGQPTQGYRIDWTFWLKGNFTFIILAGCSTGFMFLLCIGTAPLIDVAFVSLFWGVRNVSYFMTFWVIRDTHILDLGFFSENFPNLRLPQNVPWENISLWTVFGVNTALSLLGGLFYVQSALLSRNYTLYVIQPRNRIARRLAFTENNGVPKADEYGWISTAAILVYLNCKHRIAPVNIHQLLIGPNMIKAVRISDQLLIHGWYRFTILCVIKLFSWSLARTPFIGGLFGIHLLMELVYCIMSQTVRLLALRKFENKSVYSKFMKAAKERDLTSKQFSIENRNTENFISDLLKGKRFARQSDLVAYVKILDDQRRQMFLTSPGETLLPLRP